MDITINIPNRGAQGLDPSDPNFRYEVARLKLVITMSGDPAGSSVSYQGSSVTLGSTGVIGGDILDYQLTGVPNQAAVELVLQSDFVGGDFRVFDYPGNPNPRTVSLTLTGATPVSLRWAAYAAATGFGGGAYRRVSGSSGSPTLITVTTASPALPTGNARLPLDVAFVMDRSGSMEENVVPTTTKFSLLKTSISQFIDAFSVESTTQADDRLALVWFESSATIENFPAIGFWAAKSDWGIVKTRVEAQVTAGATAMGDGVSQGVKVWRDAASKSDPMLVVFTDGMQNTGNQIVDQPPIGNLDYFDIEDGTYRPLNHRSIPMGSIGIGVPANYKDTLQNIAKETGGGIYVDATPGVTGFGFHTQLIAALKGNTVALLAQGQGTVPRGGGLAGPIRFTVGNDSPQLVFCLYWLGDENPQALDLLIVRPDGSQTGPDKRIDGAYQTVQTIEKPERGDWQAFVVRSKGFEGDGQGPRGIPFYLSVLGSEGPFRLDLRHWAKDYVAGAEVYLVLELDEQARPMDLDKARGRVTIEVRAPQVDIGAYLNDLPMPTYEEILKVLGERFLDIEDPLTLKLEYYSRLGYLGPLMLPDKPTDVISFPVGDGAVLPPDVAVGAGGIAVRYAGTKYPGTYRFKAYLELESVISGAIVRQEETALALRIGAIDPKRTLIRGRIYTSGRIRYAHLDILAYDEQGNLLGPGFDDQVDLRAKLRSGGVEYIPNLNASAVYSFRLRGLLPEEDPPIQLSIFGQGVRRGLLSEFVGPLLRPSSVWQKKLTNYKRLTNLRRKRRLA